jgi:hypothetical protein
LFLSCPVYEVLYEGTRGSSKTDALLMDFAQFVGRGFGQHWRGVLFRQTYPQLTDVVAKTNKWFPRIFPAAKFNESTHTWKWPDGEELLLRWMRVPKDYWHYHGHEYPWIGWEELTNWPTDECYELMKSCSRSSHPGMPRRYRATANPYGVGHNWVKRYYISPAPTGKIIANDEGLERVRVHGHWSENRVLLMADPEYPKKLASDTNPHRRKAWLEGSWDIISGGMFDDVWDANIHVIQPFEIPKSWTVFRSHDWGSAKPSSTGWWAESDGTDRRFPRGSLIRVAELYTWTGKENEGERLATKPLTERILGHQRALGRTVEPGPADLPTADDGESVRDKMSKLGLTWTVPDAKQKSRVAGWERMRDMLLAAAQPIPEEPGLWVFNTCTQFIRTVPVLPRDEKKPDDVDTDAEDHVADESRYAAMRRDVKGKVEVFRI